MLCEKEKKEERGGEEKRKEKDEVHFSSDFNSTNHNVHALLLRARRRTMRGAVEALGLSGTHGLAVAMFRRRSAMDRAIARLMAILKLAALAAIAAAWVPHHSGIARSRIARSTSARSRIARSTGASARSRIARSTGASSRSAAVSASDAQQWIDFTTHQAKGEWHCARCGCERWCCERCRCGEAPMPRREQ